MVDLNDIKYDLGKVVSDIEDYSKKSIAELGYVIDEVEDILNHDASELEDKVSKIVHMINDVVEYLKV